MIKIEVTGTSIGEVADKLLAIGANLKGSAIVEGARAAVNAMQALGVAEQAPVDPTPTAEAATSINTDEETTAQPLSPPSEPTPPASASEAPVDKEVLRALVLSVVAAKGREAVEGILSQFGLAKASDVAAEQAAELVEALKAAL